MIIKEMSFHVFADLFKAHADLVTGLGFTKSGNVTVLLDYIHYNWRVARGPSGLIMVWYSHLGGSEWKSLGELMAVDIDSIIIS